MADNKNPSDNTPHDFEEEFDFDANEVFEGNTDQLQNTSPASAEFKSFKDRAKWPILVGILVLGFVGWKLYGILFPTTTESQLNKIATEESAAIKANQFNQANQAALPAAPHPQQAAAPAPAPAVIPADLIPPPQEAGPMLPAQSVHPVQPAHNPLPQNQNQNLEETRQLEHTVNQVNDSLSKMDQKLSLIGREFFALSDNVNRLSQEVAELKARKNVPPPPPVTKRPAHHPRAHHPKKTHHKQAKPPAESYSPESSEEVILEESVRQAPSKAVHASRRVDLAIHAIIPGRAWLRAPDGSTLTVTTGDTVPGYGKVMVIDAPSSTVVTSSGVVIR